MLTTSKKSRKQPLFIRELRQNGGFINKACEAVGISKQTVYNWRESDKAFASQWDDAVDYATEELEAEARRRAYEGVLEPVFYQGEEVGAVRKFSDTLLIFTLKARLPQRYRDNLKVEITTEDADKTIDAALIAHNLPKPDTFAGEPLVDSEM